MKRGYRNITLSILLIIFLLGTAVRFIGLGNNPIGLVDDEAQKGYDAYSLLLTGKDQWGTSWPITSFKGFGDYGLPAVTYLAILPIRFFGLTPFAVRFTPALLGTLTVLLTHFLVLELFKTNGQETINKKRDNRLPFTVYCPLLSAALLAISPWHVAMSRVGLEATTSVFFVTLGLLLFLAGRRILWLFPLSGVAFGASLYAYRPNIVLIPFAIVVLLGLFRDTYGKRLKWVAAATIVFVLVAAPILASTTGDAFLSRVRQTNLFNDSGLVDLVNEKRGSCLLSLPPTVCAAAFNKYTAYAEKFTFNYLHHFSPNLLIIHGSASQFAVLPARGLLYITEYLLVAIGVIAIFSRYTKGGLFTLLFLLFAALPDSVTSDGNPGRYFISFPSWPILAALGVTTLVSIRRRAREIIIIVMMLLAFEFVSFVVEYATFFPYRYSTASHYGYEELGKFLFAEKSNYDSIYVSNRVNDQKQYIFYLFYNRIDPAWFQTTKDIVRRKEQDGWIWVRQIGNIHFVPALPTIDKTTQPAQSQLLIAHPSEFPKTYIPVVFSIKDKKGDVIFQAVKASDFQRCITTVCTK